MRLVVDAIENLRHMEGGDCVSPELVGELAEVCARVFTSACVHHVGNENKTNELAPVTPGELHATSRHNRDTI